MHPNFIKRIFPQPGPTVRNLIYRRLAQSKGTPSKAAHAPCKPLYVHYTHDKSDSDSTIYSMSLSKSSATKRYEAHPNNARIRTEFADGVPTKPDDLTNIGNAFWNDTVIKLINAGVATAVDQSNLEALVYWWSVFVSSQESLATVTDYTTTDAARAMNAVSKAWDNFRRLANSFGLNPQARNTVSASPQGEDLDDYE